MLTSSIRRSASLCTWAMAVVAAFFVVPAANALEPTRLSLTFNENRGYLKVYAADDRSFYVIDASYRFIVRGCEAKIEMHGNGHAMTVLDYPASRLPEAGPLLKSVNGRDMVLTDILAAGTPAGGVKVKTNIDYDWLHRYALECRTVQPTVTMYLYRMDGCGLLIAAHNKMTTRYVFLKPQVEPSAAAAPQ